MGSLTVLTVSAVPPSLRGHITMYMIQVSPGVFVGRVNARVRDNLWRRVTQLKNTGAATLVFADDSEQRFQILTDLSRWDAVDLDGLTFVERYDHNSSTRRGDKYLSEDSDSLLDLEN